jgi:hypothetical protein
MIERFDFVFSYWIFAWYILYELNLTKYNPKIAVILAIFENIALLVSMFYFSNPIINILLFCFINFIIKIVPLYTIINTPYRLIDFYAAICLFIIYIFWIKLNNIKIKNLIVDEYDKLKNGQPFSPGIYYGKRFLHTTNKQY